MRCLCPAGLPARILSVIQMIGIGVTVSACAASHANYEQPSSVGAPPQQVAVAKPPKIEIEADGLAVQAPPLRRRTEPDDPSEPFSPNYGPVPSEALTPTNPERAKTPTRPERAETPTRPERAETPTRPERANAPTSPERVASVTLRRASMGPAIIHSRTTPMSIAEADAIVHRAMVEHEVRHP